MTRKVRPKQMWRPPSASDHNAMAGAADAHRRGPVGPPPQADPTIGNYVTIRNDSGADRRQYEVLKIDSDFVVAKTSRDVWVNGIEPDGTGPYAILLQPIADEKFGLAQVSGICPALVDVSAITDTKANVSSGEYALSSGSGPFDLVQQPGSTGEQLCIVRFGYEGGDIRLWRVTYGAVAATGSTSPDNNDYSAYSAIAATGTWTKNPYVALDTTAKTITFGTAGYYAVGMQLRISPFSAVPTSDLQFSALAGSFRVSGYSLVWTATGEMSSYLPRVPWIYQHHVPPIHFNSAFCQSYIQVQVGDVLGCRITRTGTDQTTPMREECVLTIGPAWSH